MFNLNLYWEWITVTKKLWIGVLISLMLVGCSNSSDKIPSKDTQVSSEKTIEIQEEYQQLNNEGKADAVVFKYNKDFMKNTNSLEINDAIAREYNRAVETLFHNDMNKFYSNTHVLVDYLILDETTYQSIMEEKNAQVAFLKNKINKLIEKEDYQSIREMETHGFEKEDSELNAMVAYADALYAFSVGGKIDSLLIHLQVSPSYTGLYSKEIKKLANQSAVVSWETEYNDYNGLKNANPADIPLTIGLTDEEVISSTSWGEPETVHRAETAGGIREQWIYPNFNYLYFEDGYLVTISTTN